MGPVLVLSFYCTRFGRKERVEGAFWNATVLKNVGGSWMRQPANISKGFKSYLISGTVQECHLLLYVDMDLRFVPCCVAGALSRSICGNKSWRPDSVP